MGEGEDELSRQLEDHEAGVADLIAAYEFAEQRYFAAIHASAPFVPRSIASNSTARVLDADLG